MLGAFVDTLVMSGSTSILGGFRIYFGEHDKTLIRRNREDDTAAVLPLNMISPTPMPDGGYTADGGYQRQ
jgi:hypothetical protein